MRAIRQYSEEFRSRAVEKLLSGTTGIKQTAAEIGIPHGTLYSWKQRYVNSSGMKKTKNKNKNNNKISAEEKLQILIETSSLKENELGEYLRKRGLHSSDLERWKSDCYSGMQQTGRPKLDPEILSLRKDKQALVKDLYRKEKALAEVSARVLLLKKSHEIFGGQEEDE